MLGLSPRPYVPLVGNPDSSLVNISSKSVFVAASSVYGLSMVVSVAGLICSYKLPTLIMFVSPSWFGCLVESAEVVSDEFGCIHLDVALLDGFFRGPVLDRCAFWGCYIDILVALSFYSEGVASAYEGSLVVDGAVFFC